MLFSAFLQFKGEFVASHILEIKIYRYFAELKKNVIYYVVASICSLDLSSGIFLGGPL